MRDNPYLEPMCNIYIYLGSSFLHSSTSSFCTYIGIHMSHFSLCEWACVHFFSSLLFLFFFFFTFIIVCLALSHMIANYSFLKKKHFVVLFFFFFSHSLFLCKVYLCVTFLSVRASPRKNKTYLCSIRQIYLYV
jgi:hypothetical protein